MDDICTGFINGFKVNFHTDISIDNYEPKEVENVRTVLFCFAGDHPGLCEVGKLLNQGKCACRRCKMVGQHLNDSSNKHMYYGENRFHYRYPWEQRNISSSLTSLYDIENETRSSVRKRMSSELGFTGISILHKYLYPLYSFDICKHLLYDVFHTICLNVVKNQAERIINLEMIDKEYLDEQIKVFPWPSKLKSGRVPKLIGKLKGMGQWKAEGLQKFSFPMADCILPNRLSNPRELEIQSMVSRLTEIHFYAGRDGWTDKLIDQHQKLSWRLNIMAEEVQGLEMCTISLHNLTHIHEDVITFSAPDNYWCAVFERAVKGYVKRSSNCKGIEATFAIAEAHREFLKPLSEPYKSVGTVNRQQGFASSIEAAKSEAKTQLPNPPSLLLGAHNNVMALTGTERKRISDTLDCSVSNIPEAAFVSKKCFMPNRGFGGTVFSSGDAVVLRINDQEENVAKLDCFISLRVHRNNDLNSLVLLCKGYCHPAIIGDDQLVLRDFWSGFMKVRDKEISNAVFFKIENIIRKVILYKSAEGTFTVADYQRKSQNLPYSVVVPVYPEKGDMLLIQGEDVNDIWYGHVHKTDCLRKTVDVYFFVKRNNSENVFVRETHGRYARNVVPWASIIGIAQGQWEGTAQWRKNT
ncbi:Hypothetical predicted protein [Paramuricea clavata]|uniref:Uncharacterized protein n=1 Tax=Paramuricea clavata TaxID=317549 RepID=A0A6S7G7L5_PARCT|nr:Hypothetical predicted protein [Paramuricea clavata]